MTDFKKELKQIINRYSVETGSNTPDFILSQYLVSCLFAYNVAIKQREKWYGQGKKSEVSNVKIDR